MADKQLSKNDTGLTRRQFIHRAGAAAAAVTVTGASGRRAAARPLGANERIGVGFIGCGGRSGAHFKTVHWLKTQAKEPIEIVAACDVYRPRMERRAKDYGAAKSYMDYRELLADPNVDVVCIATPDHHHGYQAIDAIKAGKHVYCEKPVTHWRQFELTKRLAAAVKKSNLAFQLGTQGMYDGAWAQMKKLVADGLIGRPERCLSKSPWQPCGSKALNQLLILCRLHPSICEIWVTE